MIKINNLNKYYNKGKSNEIHVLNDISLELPDTSLVTILGSSGSGKSTLLNVIGGLDKGLGSFNYFDELEMTNYKQGVIDNYRNLNIGYVFQNYHLLPQLTVYENLEYALELIGIKDKDVINERIDRALDLVGMLNYKRRNSFALSGGQQQRIAIARALVKGAKVLIADEPTGNLDSSNTIEVMNILKSISKSCLVLLVTHDKDIAYAYSDRIISLKDGKIINDEQNLESTNVIASSEALYLSDLNKDSFNLDNINLNVYSDTDEKVNINMYVEDGFLYLDLDSKLDKKVLGVNSAREIIEKRPEKEDIEGVDTSLFYEGVEKNFSYFKLFLKKMYIALITTFKLRVKSILFYILLFNIGTLLFGNGFIIYNFSTIDTDIIYNDGLYHNVELGDNPHYLPNDMWSDELSDVFLGTSTYMYGSVIPIFYGNEMSISVMYNASTTSHYDGIKRVLKDNEVILSHLYATNIVTSMDMYKKVSVNDLIGESIFIENKSYKIVEINSTVKENAVLFSNMDYLRVTDKDYSKDYKYYDYLDGKVFSKAEADALGSSLPLGTGHDFYYYGDVPSLGYLSFYELDSNEAGNLPINSLVYIESDGLEVLAKAINKYNSMTPIGGQYFVCDDYEVIEGRKAVGELEVNFPISLKGSDYETNCITNRDLKVVGYYNDENSLPYIRSNLKNAVYAYSWPMQRGIYTNNSTKLMEYFSNDPFNYECNFTYERMIDEYKTYSQQANLITVVVCSVVVGVLIVILFFLSRARMLVKIKNIGISRSLGASKKNIYINFFTESIVLTTFTIVIGYVFVHLLSFQAEGLLNLMTFKLMNPFVFILGLLGIYLITTFANLLPVFTLLRKTPIEITNKYDI